MYIFYDVDDQEIAKYEKKPKRDFFPEEKYCMFENKKTSNPDFNDSVAKKLKVEKKENARLRKLHKYLNTSTNHLETLWGDIDRGHFGEKAKNSKFYKDVQTAKELPV